MQNFYSRSNPFSGLKKGNFALSHEDKDQFYSLLTSNRKNYPRPPQSANFDFDPIALTSDIYKIHYSDKYLQTGIDSSLQDQFCKIVIRPNKKSRPKNYLVKLISNNRLFIIPWGNLHRIYKGAYFYNQRMEPENPLIQRNKDLPDKLHNFVNGQAQRTNEHLDNEIMNDRHFRECCLQRSGQNQFLYLKGKDQINPPKYRQPEYLKDLLNISFELAQRLSAVFDSSEKDGLDIDFKTFIKILYGNTPLNLDLKKLDKPGTVSKMFWPKKRKFQATNKPLGLFANKDATPPRPFNPEWIEKAIIILENLAESLSKVTVKSADFVQFDESTLYSLNTGKSISYNSEDDENEDTELEEGAGNPYTTRPLFDGSEALSHNAINEIRFSDLDRLKEIQAKFLPRKNRRTGKTYGREAWYLTSTQVSQAWIYIKARKEELKKPVDFQLSADGKNVLSWIKSLGKSREASALIHAYKDNRTANFFGIKISFSQKAPKVELDFLWSEYSKV